mgnify:CR=1 FL=1
MQCEMPRIACVVMISALSLSVFAVDDPDREWTRDNVDPVVTFLFSEGVRGGDVIIYDHRDSPEDSEDDHTNVTIPEGNSLTVRLVPCAPRGSIGQNNILDFVKSWNLMAAYFAIYQESMGRSELSRDVFSKLVQISPSLALEVKANEGVIRKDISEIYKMMFEQKIPPQLIFPDHIIRQYSIRTKAFLGD